MYIVSSSLFFSFFSTFLAAVDEQIMLSNRANLQKLSYINVVSDSKTEKKKKKETYRYKI